MRQPTSGQFANNIFIVLGENVKSFCLSSQFTMCNFSSQNYTQLATG